MVEYTRWLAFAVMALAFSGLLNAEQPAEQPIVIAVANQELASRLLPSIHSDFRLSVLDASDEGDISLLNQRALAIRTARLFVYESDGESLLQALYRERLVQHGVKTIDATPFVRRRATTTQAPSKGPLPARLAALHAAP